MFTVDTSGLEQLRMRLEEMIQTLPGAVQGAVQDSAQWIADQLGEAAPKGQHEDDDEEEEPLEGDEPGPLAESFTVTTTATDTQASATVLALQPAKLRFVVEGHGEVFPLHPKAALFWPGLDHPVMHAKAVEPNDFVTPVVQDGIEYAQVAVAVAVAEVLSILNE